MSDSLRHLPNLISAVRVGMVVPIVWALLAERFVLAVALFVIAGLSDGLDGFLAKRFGWTSRLGGILDALADKFLLVSTFICLGWLDKIPWWLVAAVLLRDLLIVIGATVYNFRIERVQPEPTLISKLNTLMQIMLAAIAVFDLAFALIPGWIIDALIVIVLATTISSGAGYVFEWSRRARTRGQHGY